MLSILVRHVEGNLHHLFERCLLVVFKSTYNVKHEQNNKLIEEKKHVLK